MDPELKTTIGLPNFPSYTSGHSTFSGAAAEVLAYLFPSDTAYFEAQKEEASISRLYGGIHFRSVLEMGKAHGKRIGGYTVSFARTDAPICHSVVAHPLATAERFSSSTAAVFRGRGIPLALDLLRSLSSRA